MLFSKLPKPKIFTLISDKSNGSRIERFDIESEFEDRHQKLIKRMEKYIDEDTGQETIAIQGDIRLVIE